MGRSRSSRVYLDVEIDMGELDDEDIKAEYERRFLDEKSTKPRTSLPLREELERIRDEIRSQDYEYALYLIDSLIRPKWVSPEACQIQFIKGKEGA